jgi:hypothetical protein
MNVTVFDVQIADTPTLGKFRRRVRNEVYFCGSGFHERGGMYSFWTALQKDPKPWTKKPHAIEVVPGRARLGLPKTDRFTRMRLDAVKKPNHRAFYTALYRSLRKPLLVTPSTSHQIMWWLEKHPVEASYARFLKYRKRGFNVS